MNTSTRTGPPIVSSSSTESAHGVLRSEEHCIFECSGHTFAIALSAVREVVSGKLATPIPQAPPALIGVVELHGDTLPVVQLNTLLGAPTRPYTPATQIIVLYWHETRLGLAVDRVLPVRVIDHTSLTPAEHALYRGWCSDTTPGIAILNAGALVMHAVQSVATRLQEACGGLIPSTPRSHLPS